MSQNTRATTKATRIRELMSDNQPRTATEIGDLLFIEPKLIREFMRRQCAMERNQGFHAVDRLGRGRSMRYLIGPGENILPRHKVDKDKLTEKEVDELHRRNVRWWPAADTLLLNSINAMVRQGARA